VYEFIKSLKPYFFSLREIKENVSLDLKIPVSWKYEKIAQVYKTLQLKIQDKNDKDTLISFICTASEEGYEIVYQCAREVVEKNLEDEKKRELFDKKVREMRDMFEKMGLEELEKLNFDKNGEPNTEGIRLVGEGDEEGSIGSGEPQTTNDSRSEEDEEGGFFPITTKRNKNK
jgi:hypothetical protein